MSGDEGSPDTRPTNGAKVVQIRRDLPAADVSAEEFPVLAYVLQTYFPNVEERRPDRSVAFVSDYRRYGDSKAEWAGLNEELGHAIRHPERAVVVVNNALALDLDPAAARTALADLSDMLNRTGDYDEAVVDEPQEVKATPQQMLDHWFFRRMTLRWPFGSRPSREVPLWGCLASGVGAGLVGYGLLSLDPPRWLSWLPLLILVLGFLITALSAATMYALRDEIRAPEKEARRQAAREEAAAAKASRPSRWRLLG